MRRARPLLGTYVEIEAEGLPGFVLERAFSAAFSAVACVGRLMSFHDPHSDLSRLNRRAAWEPVAVHPWTAMVLRRACRMFRDTGGYFNCAVGHELVSWELLPPDGLAHVGRGDLSAVEFVHDGRIRFKKRIALDLGGVAKGFAVDRAIAALRSHGVRDALVNAGGDLRVIGGTAQPIHIRCPLNPRRLLPLGLLQNGAIATSSAAATLRSVHGRRVSALVQTATREPVLDDCAYSVIAPTCLVADALTKVLAQVKRTDAPYFERFGAVAMVTPPSSDAWEGA